MFLTVREEGSVPLPEDLAQEFGIHKGSGDRTDDGALKLRSAKSRLAAFDRFSEALKAIFEPGEDGTGVVPQVAPGRAGSRPGLPSGVTHVLDTSAALASTLGERGADRARALIGDPQTVAGVSVLTFYEVYTVLLHRTGSYEIAT